MNFQIKPLQRSDFAHLFELTDAELAAQHACRQIVSSKPGTPCRVSMQDAEVGETVILFNYEHQPEDSPYKASHAVFIRERAEQANLAINEVPDVIRSRLMSMRYFDKSHMMIDADVVSGDRVAEELSKALENDEIAYVHLHNAKPGCFAASVYRAC
ncbi:DUF1203 domain-containing protein [Tateyamaria omphalii]|uniref:DUF1203 domain-containing protein n=1 Tax=Tateyamaria omphalii TaxID=299262 RepID=A0A1P8MWR2_9RHOB|nr:DUF1203 domain-containing protein [Tateyamaria omphalii]APX12547.1 hypothetical protein BWR18_13310 [Tateyamaria omphalii]